MMWKFLIISSSLAAIAKSSRPPRFDAREVMRLITTVDPDTCGCISLNHGYCEIKIPNINIIGLDCGKIAGPGTHFCCRSRSFIKPFVTPGDLQALHAAAKRFKVEGNYIKTPIHGYCMEGCQASLPSFRIFCCTSFGTILIKSEEIFLLT